eukprot:scaffold8225_cov129-Isochrysis_galbana.AAC.8
MTGLAGTARRPSNVAAMLVAVAEGAAGVRTVILSGRPSSGTPLYCSMACQARKGKGQWDGDRVGTNTAQCGELRAAPHAGWGFAPSSHRLSSGRRRGPRPWTCRPPWSAGGQAHTGAEHLPQDRVPLAQQGMHAGQPVAAMHTRLEKLLNILLPVTGAAAAARDLEMRFVALAMLDSVAAATPRPPPGVGLTRGEAAPRPAPRPRPALPMVLVAPRPEAALVLATFSGLPLALIMSSRLMPSLSMAVPIGG